MPRTKFRTRPSRPSAGVNRKLLRRTSLPGPSDTRVSSFSVTPEPSVAASPETVGLEDLLANLGRHAVAAADDEDLSRCELDPSRRRRLLRERRCCQYCQHTYTDPASSIHHDDLQLPGVHESADNVSKGSTPRYVGRISGASTGPDSGSAQAGARAHAIMTFRGCCELSSRKVFLFSSASAVGCTSPVDVGHARDERVLAGRRAGPRVGEQLPRILAVGRRIDRRRLPRAVVDFDLDRLDRRAIVQDDAEHFVPVAVAA